MVLAHTLDSHRRAGQPSRGPVGLPCSPGSPPVPVLEERTTSSARRAHRLLRVGCPLRLGIADPPMWAWGQEAWVYSLCHELRFHFSQVSLLTARKLISECKIRAAASSHLLLPKKEKEREKSKDPKQVAVSLPCTPAVRHTGRTGRSAPFCRTLVARRDERGWGGDHRLLLCRGGRCQFAGIVSQLACYGAWAAGSAEGCGAPGGAHIRAALPRLAAWLLSCASWVYILTSTL